MSKLAALVLMQLKDKIDLSFVKDRKKAITKAVLSIVKFAVVVAVCYLILWISQRLLVLFELAQTPEIMIVVMTVLLVLTTLSCTAGLANMLFFADDNRVLVTFPVSPNVLFISKLLVYYIYELIRSFSLLVPLLLAFGLTIYPLYISISYFFVIWPIILLIVALPVLLGAFLSVPAMYLTRLIKRFPVIGAILFAAVAALVVYLLISIIGIIPDHIVLTDLMPELRPHIDAFLAEFSETNFFVRDLVSLLIGEKIPASNFYEINGTSVWKFALIVGLEALLFALVMLVVKLFFFVMMRKNFEYARKSIFKKRANPRHGKYFTFIIKEWKISVRDFKTMFNYVSVYVLVPIMLYLLNKMFASIDKNLTGNYLSYAFNMLILLLPMLSSNALIAKSFSKEGRSAYIKKTKPIKVVIPLTAKFLPNLVFGAISVIASVSVIAYFGEMPFGDAVLLFFGALLIFYAHMFVSASLDLMNPQNEQYATSGEVENNKNESTSTLIAFIASAFLALVSFFLFRESAYAMSGTLVAALKIFGLGALAFAASVYMYTLRIRAYYYDR